MMIAPANIGLAQTVGVGQEAVSGIAQAGARRDGRKNCRKAVGTALIRRLHAFRANGYDAIFSPGIKHRA